MFDYIYRLLNTFHKQQLQYYYYEINIIHVQYS